MRRFKTQKHILKDNVCKAKDAAARSIEIEDAVYDLKAVNPNKKCYIDVHSTISVARSSLWQWRMSQSVIHPVYRLKAETNREPKKEMD